MLICHGCIVRDCKFTLEQDETDVEVGLLYPCGACCCSITSCICSCPEAGTKGGVEVRQGKVELGEGGGEGEREGEVEGEGYGEDR